MLVHINFLVLDILFGLPTQKYLINFDDIGQPSHHNAKTGVGNRPSSESVRPLIETKILQRFWSLNRHEKEELHYEFYAKIHN